MTLQQLQQLAQWVIDNRYGKSEQEKVSDSEMYQYITEQLERAYQLGMEDAFKIATEQLERITMAFNPKV